MSNSYYKTIDGKNYDREMLEIADEAVAGVGDGRISIEDAQKLLDAVKDADKYTDVEKATMKYIRDNYKFTYASDQWFRKEIRKWAATKGKENFEKPKPTVPSSQAEFVPHKSYYRTIDGKHYVSSLIEAADKSLEGKGNGLISEEDFQKIIELSRNGKGITGTEMRTIEYIGLKYNLTTKARLWFDENLEQIRNEVIEGEHHSEKKHSQAVDKEQEKVFENEQSSEKKLYQEVDKEQEKVIELDSYENKKTANTFQRPNINGNHQKSLLLVHVLWAALLLISIITVRSIFIDQVADAEQNLEKLLGVKQNNILLEERLKTMQIEKTQLESKFQGLEQSLSDQIMKQKNLEVSLSLEKSQALKQAKDEVVVIKSDQNNCCFCSCGNSAIEESL